MHFIYFLGRFHVLVLHLPITLILVVAALEWLERGGRRPELEPALRLLWGATALSAVLTVILGYMHFAEGGFSGATAHAHRALGTSVAVVSLAAWWIRSQPGVALRQATGPVVALLVILVAVTGHLGGSLTHGNDYLVQYAPNFIRSMMGLAPERGPVTRVAAADPYLDVIRPIFAERCLNCHNPDKRRGGLDLSRYAGVIKGGEDGAVIVKGNPGASDMIRRVSLTPGADDFMPKDGKTPLTANEVAILRWWIQGGARTGVTVGQLQPPAAIEKLIGAQLHLEAVAAANPTPAAAQPAAQEIALGAAEARADPRLVSALVNVGFEARQVSMLDPHLIVNPTAPGVSLTATQIQALAPAGTQIRELDLTGAGLNDAAIAPLARLAGLTVLKLDRNRITDKGVKTLAGLNALQELGLYGNPGVTDASVAILAAMKSLKKVYLWESGVTAGGVSRLRQARPDLVVDFGDLASPAAPLQQGAAGARSDPGRPQVPAKQQP